MTLGISNTRSQPPLDSNSITIAIQIASQKPFRLCVQRSISLGLTEDPVDSVNMADDLGCTSAERTPVGQIRKVCERDI